VQNYFGAFILANSLISEKMFYNASLLVVENSCCTWTLIATNGNVALYLAIVSIFAPFNFAVLCSSQNLQNKRHVNDKGFIVSLIIVQIYCSSQML